jgi:hypothetical protein
LLLDRVCYIQGSALNDLDLARARTQCADAVFFISDNTTSEDERNVLRVWAVAQFAPQVDLYIYTHRPEFERFHLSHATACICADDMRQALLGYNCIHRGVATLITNLIFSSTPTHDYHLPWMVQYGDGMGHEIFNCTVPEIFIGKSFHHLVTVRFRPLGKSPCNTAF